jgi:hypothetical protein
VLTRSAPKNPSCMRADVLESWLVCLGHNISKSQGWDKNCQPGGLLSGLACGLYAEPCQYRPANPSMNLGIILWWLSETLLPAGGPMAQACGSVKNLI